MNKFHKKISSKNVTPNLRVRCLTALTRLSPDQIHSFAAFEPWFIWSAEAAVDAR